MHEWEKKKKNNKKLRKEDFLKDLNISRSTFFLYQKIYEELTEAQKKILFNRLVTNMASIRKGSKTYQVSVSNGRDSRGKQIIESATLFPIREKPKSKIRKH